MPPRNRFADIKPFFEKAEWDELGDYEKTSFMNAKENYEAMIRAGLTPRKPFFMMNHEERLKTEEKLKSGRGRPPGPAKKRTPAPAPPPGEPTRKSRRVQELYCLDEENKENPEAEEELLFCVDCDASWSGDCPKHGAYKVLEDSKVPDDTPSELRVEASLPAGLVVRNLESDGTVFVTRGVFAEVKLARRTRLGPFKGDVPEDNKDPSSENNWMALLRDVSKRYANIYPMQYAAKLYFVTIEDIPAGEELSVSYPKCYKRDKVCGREFFSPLTLAQHQRANPSCAAELARRRRALVEKRALERSALYAPPARAARPPSSGGSGEDRKLKRELMRELQELTVNQILDVEKLIEEGKHDCPQCGEHFGRGCRLRRHMEEQHQPHDTDMQIPGTSCPFTCRTCSASFSLGKDLRSHVLLTHFELARRGGGAGPADATAASASASVSSMASAFTSQTSSVASSSTASALASQTSSSTSDGSSEGNSTAVEVTLSNSSLESALDKQY
ncbi:Histone-lysine N-methyltransferase PRDM9 [Frankliniella fusca]|uniref:Histone-lysine N-methyltransferase PRDM9 n=1 Tax=Frankliniella fusca TaxID=407009 RepID=A0AAE1LNH8_9NEOP|nr:Histone-lysine N-methyltransferase PRDM9 [Frankliniella fusca]